jgi:hypothetical protein
LFEIKKYHGTKLGKNETMQCLFGSGVPAAEAIVREFGTIMEYSIERDYYESYITH